MWPSLLTCYMFLLWPTLLLFFYGLLYYFSAVLRAASTRVYHNASVSVYCNKNVYIVSLRMCGVSTFAFKFFLIIYKYAKRSATWNMFLFLVVWQEFKSPWCFPFFNMFHVFALVYLTTGFSDHLLYLILRSTFSWKWSDRSQQILLVTNTKYSLRAYH